ncbi:hypothetical protein CCS01_27785 [Rhodopila globiformis]|uniref:histidine kinase n=1 Tax=Rhodopila globiformis TaxID=1071 RepID=A0A2S6MYB8_RHOGL|nr:hypothetical protein CCS01_27785 [Rhodopila globiformis]
MTPSSSTSTLEHGVAASLNWRDDGWLFSAICALLLIAVIAVTTFIIGLPYMRERLSAASSVEHTYEVIGTIGDFLLGIQNLESSQQHYLLTRDQAALASYNRGVDRARRGLSQLQQLTLDNPHQQDRLHTLQDQVHGLLTITNRANAAADSGNVRDAADMIQAGDAAKLRNGIRHTVDDVVAEEQQLLRQRRDAQADLYRRTVVVFIGLSATAAGGLLLGGFALAMALRAARSARRETAERQRLLAMMDLAAVMLRDFDGIVRFWSEGCHRLYGWTATEAVGRPAHALLQTVFPIPQAEIEGRLRRDQEWSGELRQKTRDGTDLIVQARKLLRPGANGQVPLIMENVTDVTPQARAETALRENEARLRLAQQVGGIASADWTTSEPRALCSEEFRRLYGLPPQQDAITQAAWLDLIHPGDRDRVATEMRAVAEHTDSVASEFRIRRDDGGQRWIAMRAVSFAANGGKARRVISAHQDVTDLVAAREDLTARRDDLERQVAERTAAVAEAEMRFRAIFDSQFQLISLLAPDGTTLEVNRTALETGGLARHEVVGHKFWTVGGWPRSERERLPEEVAAAAAGSPVRREAELHGTNGRSIWIDYSLKPVRDAAGGRVEWIIAEGHDVTERRAMAESLAQAKKMQALSQLAAGIAHDFNNILQAVSGAATMAARRPEDHDRARRFAQISIDAAARGAAITERLLSFARQGEMHTEAIPVTSLLGNLRELLTGSFGSAITVQTAIAPDVPMVLADRAQIETVLVNLGTNAREAMPQGGTLTLSAEPVHVVRGGPFPADVPPGDYVRIAVADTGVGMNATTLARMAEPFFSTKQPGQAIGLSLAMAKGFVEQCGGAFTISSTPGAGTTVSLWLPQAAEEAQVQAGTDLDGQHSLIPARVLIVDDDDFVREVLAAQLEAVGFATLVASSGNEAVALLESGETVDVLISDLAMPGINGIETIQRARALRPRMPCFLVTGYATEQAAPADESVFTLLRKPVSADTLARQIEAAVRATRG